MISGRRIWADIKNRRHLEAYVATTIAVLFSALGIVGDIVPDGLKWSAVFAGLGFLIFRVALPVRPSAAIEELLSDRTALARLPFAELVHDARQVWIFAPSGINVLSASNCNALRQTVLNRGDGDLKVVLLDPNPDNSTAIDLAVRQLDDSLQYPVQDFKLSLSTTVDQLKRMATWSVAGKFDYGFLPYNPGFSMVAIDPSLPNGKLIVEFHGYRNEATDSRMHLTLTRADTTAWYSYWIQQYEAIWTASRKAQDAGPTH